MAPRKAKPLAFFPNLDVAVATQKEITKTIGVVYLSHGEPKVEEMTSSIRLISLEFTRFDWKFIKVGPKFLVKLPSEVGLTHVVGRASIPC